MFAGDVRFEGFTATDWSRVLALFRPRRTANAPRDPERARGGVVAVHDGKRLRKLVHTEVGRLRLEDAQRDWPLGVEELARRHHASWAVTLELGALERIMDRFASRARAGGPTTQLITVASLAREEMVGGAIDVWPGRMRGMPIPSPGVVRGTFDSICPAGKTMLVGLFEQGELWTSVAMRRTDRGVDLVLGPDEIRADMGLLAGDWRRDCRHLARAVEERCGPLALGCYAEATRFQELEVDPTPGAWARAVAVRDVILAPLSPPLAILLGIDAGRAAFGALRAVAERIDPVGVVGPALAALREFAGRATGEDGEGGQRPPFSPLELLRKLLSRER
ncbi:MAG: hypothetical protein WKG00_30305 [Polyangiaceae bacterium]